jgi:hypothetical protein
MDSSPVSHGALWSHVVWLFLLALPVATVSWTITHEEIFREWREFCLEHSRTCRRLSQRKFFYVFTCEYCFSHYVTLFFLAITRFQLLLEGWRGYLLALFAIVAIANVYMSLFGRLRVDIRSERLDVAVKEAVKEDVDAGRLPPAAARPVGR